MVLNYVKKEKLVIFSLRNVFEQKSKLQLIVITWFLEQLKSTLTLNQQLVHTSCLIAVS